MSSLRALLLGSVSAAVLSPLLLLGPALAETPQPSAQPSAEASPRAAATETPSPLLPLPSPTPTRVSPSPSPAQPSPSPTRRRRSPSPRAVVTVIPAPSDAPSPTVASSPSRLDAIPLESLDPSPQTSATTAAKPAPDRSGGSRLNRYVQLTLGGALLLGLAGAVGLYLTRS